MYWTKEDIDSACQVYAIHIAVTNHLVCTIDTDVPGAEAFADLFAEAPRMRERISELDEQLEAERRNLRILNQQLANCHDTMRKDGIRHGKLLLAVEDDQKRIAELEAQLKITTNLPLPR